MKATTLAKLERVVRPAITRFFPPNIVVKKYSQGRIDFLEKLSEEVPNRRYVPTLGLSVTLWGIKFQSPIMNAAGMFKNGESYGVVSKQGAGGYLGGTGTLNSRVGNEKNGISLPFVPYPKSHSASNWLGLPNDGDNINSSKAGEIVKSSRCPVGWSVMGSPDFQGQEKLDNLVDGMKKYELARVDFIEINESCPNTSHGKPQKDDMANRLRYVKEHFLDRRTKFCTGGERVVPVVVKFSNDTEVQQVPELLDLLFELDYDGVNFGNTSTQYNKRREFIHPSERKLFDFFTNSKEFGVGGGVSGRVLKDSSLALCTRAVEYTKSGSPSQEFHVIRTGGIESINDINDSNLAGVSMNQWFTGYFEGFSKHGHDIYRKLFEF